MIKDLENHTESNYTKIQILKYFFKKSKRLRLERSHFLKNFEKKIMIF